MGSKCVEGAAQSHLSLSKCVNKVAQWGAQLVDTAHVQWRTAPADGARGGRVTNQIWRNLMLAWPWEPRDTRGGATDLRQQHKHPHPRTQAPST